VSVGLFIKSCPGSIPGHPNLNPWGWGRGGDWTLSFCKKSLHRFWMCNQFAKGCLGVRPSHLDVLSIAVCLAAGTSSLLSSGPENQSGVGGDPLAWGFRRKCGHLDVSSLEIY
jgi:hypothetical protein